ncbi:hypothetical protein HanPI659440_Chr09g0326591 [Helianthus annuus]|nr:hypothetical protein HanPI659440_Chr09g0326591 [Helianthus annuus]
MMLLLLLLVLPRGTWASTILGLMPHLVTSLTLTFPTRPTVMSIALVALGVVPAIATLLLRALVVVSFPLLGWGLSGVSILALISFPLTLVVTRSSSCSTDPFGQLALFHGLISEFVSKTNDWLNGIEVGCSHMASNFWSQTLDVQLDSSVHGPRHVWAKSSIVVGLFGVCLDL